VPLLSQNLARAFFNFAMNGVRSTIPRASARVTSVRARLQPCRKGPERNISLRRRPARSCSRRAAFLARRDAMQRSAHKKSCAACKC